jgi:putative Mg2+ transporter-C (MgtC) family protein
VTGPAGEAAVELLEFAGNVGLALVLGAAIGVERQFRHHPAGLRTNALVSVGAALFVSLTRLMGGEPNSPTRIASYITVGIGFLGGGVISKEGSKVRGLTTAAGVWCSAAVGTIAGAGFGLHAVAGTVLVLVVLVGLVPVEKGVDALQKRLAGREAHYRIRVACGEAESTAVRDALVRLLGPIPGATVTGIRSQKQSRRKRVFLTADMTTRPADDRAIQEAVGRLLTEPGVRSASWQVLPPGE